MTTNIQNLSDEDAFGICVDFLRKTLKKAIPQSFQSNHNFDVSANDVVDWCLDCNGIGRQNKKLEVKKAVSRRILTALWQLCLKGVLRPSVLELSYSGGAVDLHPGDGYTITEQGREWLSSGSEFYPLVSSQAFLHQLLKHGERFGSVYMERAKDAVLSNDATAYFACCAMCGAASESIIIALAAQRKGNMEEVIKIYRKSDGRKRIQDILESGKPSGLIRILSSGFSILSFWRDTSAHGEQNNVDRSEATLALQTLLTLAQFADERWDDITSNKSADQISPAPHVPTKPG